MAINEITNTTTATIDESEVDITGNSDITATSNAKIDSLTMGGSGTLNIAQNGGGFAFAGAFAASGNRINNTITAGLLNGAKLDVSGTARIAAIDDSDIVADAGGIGVAFALNTQFSGGLSFGAGVAINDINNTVNAVVDNSTLAAASTSIAAQSEAKIEALTLAGAVSGSVGSVAIAGAGAASVSINNIDNTVEAAVKNGARVTTDTGNVNLAATDDSVIQADGGAAALAIALGKFGGALGFGTAIGRNKIGKDEGHSVRAYIDNANVNAAGDVLLDATSTADIDAYSYGGSFVGAAGKFGAALSGSLVDSRNEIGATVESYITNVSNDANGIGVDATGSVSLTANDTANINSQAFAEANSISVGVVSVSGSVGATVAKNDIANTVRTYIGTPNTSDTTTVDALGGAVTLDASADSTITAETVAAANSAAISIGGAFSGAWADVKNMVNNKVESFIGEGTTVNALEAVTVKADDTSKSTSTVGSDTVNIGLIVGSVGVSKAEDVLTPTVSAFIGNNAQVTSTTRSVDLLASANARSNVSATGTAIAIGLGLGSAGAEAFSTITPTLLASVGTGAVVNAGTDVNILSTSTTNSQVFGKGKSGALVTIGSITANATVNNNNTASNNGQINAGENVTLRATSNLNDDLDGNNYHLNTDGTANGVVGGTGINASIDITDRTTAETGIGSQTNAGNTATVEALANIEGRAQGNFNSDFTGISSNTTNVNVNINTLPKVSLGGDITADVVKINAKVTNLDADAKADSRLGVLNTTTNANANLNITSNTQVEIASGADIIGTSELDIISRQDNVDTLSDATGKIVGFTGTINANSTNNADFDSTVDVAAGANLTTLDFEVEAIAPNQDAWRRQVEADGATVVNTIVETIEVVEKVTPQYSHHWCPCLIGH